MASHQPGMIKLLALGLTLAQALVLGAGGPAQAQFFQPFGYRDDMPPVDEERPRFATPRAVSRILARRGFELVSGLGRRGDQVVVTGVSRRDGAFRFFIDPYEGEVIHAVRLGPSPAEGPPSYDEPPFPGRREGPWAPVENDVARRSARQGLEPPPPGGARPPRPVQPSAKASPPPSAPVAAPTAAAPQSAPKAPELPKPIEWAKPAEIARPAERAKPAMAAPAAEKAPVDPKASEPKSAAAAAERPGVAGRRAIVAPGSTGDAAAATSR